VFRLVQDAVFFASTVNGDGLEPLFNSFSPPLSVRPGPVVVLTPRSRV